MLPYSLLGSYSTLLFDIVFWRAMFRPMKHASRRRRNTTQNANTMPVTSERTMYHILSNLDYRRFAFHVPF